MVGRTDTATSLSVFGWSAPQAQWFRAHAAAGAVAARVIDAARHLAVTEAGLREYVIQRHFQRGASELADYPAVGDWLALEPLPGTQEQAALREVAPRRGAFVRQLSDGRAQVLAANVDVALLVSGLDHDLNLRRIERYLVLALDGDVTPVVVLNKADIASDLGRAVAEVHAVAAGTRVVVTSALDGTGVDELRAILAPGRTGCLLGSSGVGKSSITNALLGEERQNVVAIRDDDSRGRHTTTHRELFVLPGAGLIVDTPGLRSVGVLGRSESLAATFQDLQRLARACHFSDCRHETEPGCAVRAAVDDGRLAPERLASHQKLEAERRYAELRTDDRARREADRRWGRAYKRLKKEVRGRGQYDD